MRFTTGIFTLLILNFLSSLAFAQLGNSPYSRLGLGELIPQGSVYHLGMGGISVATSSPAYLNFGNPALLSRNSLVGFEAGFSGEAKLITSQGASERNSNGNLSYLAFAFPLAKYWTLGVGVRPYSNINYIDKSEQKIPQTPSFIEYAYKGSGGITQAFISNGIRIYKGLSIGFQANYNFGSINTESVSTIIDNQTTTFGSYVIAIYDQNAFSDFSYKTGLSYALKVSKNAFLNFGATYDLEANLGAQRFRAIQRRDIRGQILSSDTLSLDRGVKANVPAKTSFGISLERAFKYNVGADFSIQDWSSFQGLVTKDSLTKIYQFKIGGEYTPNLTSINSYLARMTYRLGFSYAQLPYILNGKQLDERAVHLGFSLPLNRGYSALNFAFVAGQRGATSGNLLQETFFRINLGMTVNDAQWFFRRKIN
jgi:hypothetical protein